MAVKLTFVYPDAEQYIGGQDSVEVDGGTVNECLADLVKKYPATRELLLDKNGQVQSYFTFFVNGEFYPAVELSHPVNSGDELTVSVAMSGG